MHYHLEIVMPPTDYIRAAVEEILAPFSENATEEERRGPSGFWDFWVIGGRFAGCKFQATLNPEKLEQFNAELQKRKVTVSGLTCGKQELMPASQIPMVDALWNEYFPQANGGSCPLFNHSNDQYKSDSLLPDDVMRFWEMPDALEMGRIIFAAPAWRGEGIEAVFMLADSIWNGCNHEDTAWNGTWANAVKQFREKELSASRSTEYIERVTPQDDWLVVTVDYHS